MEHLLNQPCHETIYKLPIQFSNGIILGKGYDNVTFCNLYSVYTVYRDTVLMVRHAGDKEANNKSNIPN